MSEYAFPESMPSDEFYTNRTSRKGVSFENARTTISDSTLESPAASEDLYEISTWQPLDKSQLLRHEYGFDPHNCTERNEAVEHVVQRHSASHLNEVLLHQIKAGVEDPQAALRYLVRQYGTYAKEAHAEAGIVGLAIEELHDANALKNFAAVYDLQTACGTRVRQSLSRQINTDRFLEEGNTDFDPLLKKTKESTDTYAQIEIAKLRVGETRERLRRVVENERQRQQFWIDQLEGAKHHLVVRNMAQAILSNTVIIRK